MRTRRISTVATVVAGLILAGCGGSDDASSGAPIGADPGDTAVESTTPAEITAPPSAPPAAEVPELLDFTAPTVDGGTFEGADLLGKPAVLWFWAPWCPVCRREAPLMADLADQHAGQVSFVGIAGLSGDVGAMSEFVADGGVASFPHIDDRDGSIYAHFGVTQQYDFGFVSADGEVEIVTGPLSEDEITDRVDALAGG